MACNVYTTQEAAQVFCKVYLKFPIFGSSAVTAPARELVGIVALGALVKDQRDLIEPLRGRDFPCEPAKASISRFRIPNGDHSSSSRLWRDLQGQLQCQHRRSSDGAATSEECMAAQDDLLAYKARPLTGIWATAPYLHDGSVPTLYDLLLPPDAAAENVLHRHPRI